MNEGLEQKIRERAYAIWLAAGQADGAASEHWHLAERALRDEAEMPRPATASPAPIKARTAKAAVSKAASRKKAAPEASAKPAAVIAVTKSVSTRRNKSGAPATTMSAGA